MKWFGHVKRMQKDRLLYKMLNLNVKEKRPIDKTPNEMD